MIVGPRASALVKHDPPEGEPVWLRIRLDDARPTGWIGAIVVEVARVGPFSRRRRVRLRFCEGCPPHALNGARGRERR